MLDHPSVGVVAKDVYRRPTYWFAFCHLVAHSLLDVAWHYWLALSSNIQGNRGRQRTVFRTCEKVMQDVLAVFVGVLQAIETEHPGKRRKVSLVILFMITRQVRISLSSRAWKASAIQGVSLVK